MATPLRVEQRLKALEEGMTALERLPDRMDRLDVRMEGLDHRMDRLESEVVQLRTEMRDEFAAVRREMATGDDRVMTTLSARIEDARRETRVLHEDVIDRIALLGEGLRASSDALAFEMRAMGLRLTAIENRLPTTRRRKKT